MEKSIFFVTHGQTVRSKGKRKPYDPAMTAFGIKQVVETKNFLQGLISGFSKIVVGMGQRFEQMRNVFHFSKTLVVYNTLVGSQMVMERLKNGRIIVNTGKNIYNRDQYDLTSQCPSIRELLFQLPDNSIILGSRAMLYALGVEHAHSATVYKFRVNNKHRNYKLEILYSAPRAISRVKKKHLEKPIMVIKKNPSKRKKGRID